LSEEHDILGDVSGCRPADVLIHGAGPEKRDLCVDVVVYDERNRESTSQPEQERRAQSTGRAARVAERVKRAAKIAGCDRTKAEMLWERGKAFTPLGFEVGGGQGATWAKLLKNLSDFAHQRRGHHKAYFVKRWRTQMAATLIKRGAEVALRRAYSLKVASTFSSLGPTAETMAQFGDEFMEGPLLAR